MKIPEYISPTALMAWEKNSEEYYLQYLADKRPPKIPQTQPMAVGASFDAYVKNYCHEVLFGKNNDANFQFASIFESQVEPHNRDWALGTGQYCFECYKNTGALADLLIELQQAQATPRFEFTVKGTIGGVPLLGKPDLFFIHKSGKPIILDFKVNGFCSKTGVSPSRGYCRIRPTNQVHKDCLPMNVGGIHVNIQEYLETINKEWGLQLSTYAWLMGAEVGSEFICALDQLVCRPTTDPDKPEIRIAEHRLYVGPEFQQKCLSRYTELWSIINSNHIFRELSLAESNTRCQMLDEQYKAFEDGDDFIKEMTGRSI